MSDFVSPIQFDNSYLASIEFDLSEGLKHFKAPPNLGDLSHSLEVSHARNYEETEGKIGCWCDLAVRWSVEALDDEKEYSSLFHAKAEIAGWARCPIANYETEEVQEVLAASNIGFLWATLRDHFDSLTGASAIGRIQLPAISPYALLEKNEGEGDPGSE